MLNEGAELVANDAVGLRKIPEHQSACPSEWAPVKDMTSCHFF